MLTPLIFASPNLVPVHVFPFMLTWHEKHASYKNYSPGKSQSALITFPKLLISLNTIFSPQMNVEDFMKQELLYLGTELPMTKFNRSL